MKTQNVLGVLGVAAATMAFTLSVFGPWNTGISEDAKSVQPTILTPKFASHGCEFTLKTAKPAYKPGESPVIDVTAVNPSGKAAETTVWVNVFTAEVPSPLARTLVMPRSAWSKSWCVTLRAGETRTISLASDVKLKAGQNVTITIGDKKQSVLVGELPVRRNEPLKKAAAQK
jgi:hypothetical protein